MRSRLTEHIPHFCPLILSSRSAPGGDLGHLQASQARSLSRNLDKLPAWLAWNLKFAPNGNVCKIPNLPLGSGARLGEMGDTDIAVVDPPGVMFWHSEWPWGCASCLNILVCHTVTFHSRASYHTSFERGKSELSYDPKICKNMLKITEHRSDGPFK